MRAARALHRGLGPHHHAGKERLEFGQTDLGALIGAGRVMDRQDTARL